MSGQLISSANVKIFPSTKRVDQQHSSRALSQAALVGLINQLLDRQSFVISQNTDGKFVINSENGFIQVNICGYYFKVLTSQIKTFIDSVTGISTVYLWAKFLQGTSSYDIEQLPRMNLIGNDDSYIQFDGQTISQNNVKKVQGLKLNNVVPDPNNVQDDEGWKSILILEKIGENWRIPSDSQIKFNLTRLPATEITGVDGGDGTQV